MASNQTIETVSRELAALAYLEASRQVNSGSDRLAYFMPIVEESISQLANVSFTPETLRDKIQSQFRINLPVAVISSLLSRCCNRGYLTKNHGHYSRTPEQIPLSALREKRQELERDTDRLIASAKRILSRDSSIQGDWTDEKVETGLFSFIDSVYGDASTAQITGTEDDIELWASIVSMGLKDDAEAMATIEALGRGAIVRDAAFFPSLITSSQAFRNTIVFLDSPIICWLLGMSSYEHERYAKEAVETLRQCGVVCRVLSRTVDEIHGILYAIEKDWGVRMAEPSPNSYSRFMRQRGFTKDRVFELRSILSQEIEALGFRIVDSHQRNRNYVSDEASLAERLSDANSIDGIWSNRVQHDVDCIAEVLTIREGCEPRQLNDVKAVFAAISYRTISNVLKWWTEDEGHSESVIPPILKFENLVNYVWLSNPITAFNGIGREAAMITCASAMLPSQDTWNAYMSKLDAMVESGSISAEKALAIIQSNDLDLILRKEEKASIPPDYSDNDTFERVTDEVIRSISRPILDAQAADYEKNIAELESEHVLELERKQDEIGKQQDRIEQMQEQINRLERQRINGIIRKSKRRAIAASAFVTVLLLAAIAGILYLFTGGFSNDGSFNNAFIISVGIGIVGAIGVLIAVPKSVYRYAFRKMHDRLNGKDMP